MNRQDFEDWVQSHGGSTDRTDGGEYRSSPTECAWSAWQAATAKAVTACSAIEDASLAKWHSDLPMVGELAMLVARLARKLRKATPGDELPAQALDYLNRNDLNGSPLREVAGGGTAVTREMIGAIAGAHLSGDVCEEAQHMNSPVAVAVRLSENDMVERSFIVPMDLPKCNIIANFGNLIYGIDTEPILKCGQ